MLQLPSEDRSVESRSTSQYISKPQNTWKTPSLSVVAEAIPGSSWFHSEDANILLLILSFFSTRNEFTLDLLFRGAMPRKRWTSVGEVEELDATRVGLDPHANHVGWCEVQDHRRSRQCVQASLVRGLAQVHQVSTAQCRASQSKRRRGRCSQCPFVRH